MKALAFFLSVGLLTFQSTSFAGATWLADFAKSRQEAEKGGKLILLDFTGSDWCGWCIKLKKEVFDKKEFIDYAKNNLVLVEVDFPTAKKKLSDEQRKANEELKNKYNATRGFPTIVVTDSSGKEIWRQVGYMEGGPKEWIRKLAEMRYTTPNTPMPSYQEQPREILPTPLIKRRDDELLGTGSGFMITEDGYLITNFHVVKGGTRFQIKTQDEVMSAKLIKVDEVNDLAVLKVSGRFQNLPLAPSSTIRSGNTVFTVGFPNPELQGYEPKFTKGEISSLSGLRDDPRRFQITVAVQPGNSGGPLVDESGNVIGIVVARLNDSIAFRATGSLPQNVNYAIKSSYALALLETLPNLTGKLRSPNQTPRPFADLVKDVQDSIAFVMVY